MPKYMKKGQSNKPKRKNPNFSFVATQNATGKGKKTFSKVAKRKSR